MIRMHGSSEANTGREEGLMLFHHDDEQHSIRPEPRATTGRNARRSSNAGFFINETRSTEVRGGLPVRFVKPAGDQGRSPRHSGLEISAETSVGE